MTGGYTPGGRSLDPGIPLNRGEVARKSGRIATDFTTTVPAGYRTASARPSDDTDKWWFTFTPMQDRASGRLESTPSEVDEAEVGAICHKTTTRKANGHTHEREAVVVRKEFRVPRQAGGERSDEADKVKRKTLRCPEGFSATSVGYSSASDSDFRFLFFRLNGRKAIAYYTAAKRDTFTLWAYCVADVVS